MFGTYNRKFSRSSGQFRNLRLNFLLAASSTSSLIKSNSSFSLLICCCCSNWRSLRSSSIWAQVFVTCSICSWSAVVNKSSSSFFDSTTGSCVNEIGLVVIGVVGGGETISGCNVAVSTSGNTTFSPF